MNGESETIVDIGKLVECKRENEMLNVIDNEIEHSVFLDCQGC